MRSPRWLTHSRNPRPTSWRRLVTFSGSAFFSMPITNTFGLSHPSRNAECAKMNLTGSSKLSNCAFRRRIRSYASTSSEVRSADRPPTSGSTSRLLFLSIEK